MVVKNHKEGNSMAAVRKSQQQAVNRYISEHYDRINLTLPQGQKEVIRAFAEKSGESVNSFIARAINEAMDRATFAEGDQ